MSRSAKSVIHQANRRKFWSLNSRTRSHIITKFVNKIGLVYFGSVDRTSDDYDAVRGFTVSSSHQDDHFSVGSVEGYDVAIVDRSDAIWQPDGSIEVCNWLIMSFKLHTKVEIPHFFLSAKGHDSKAYASLHAAFPSLKEINLGTFEAYDHEFLSRFSLYSQPMTSIEVERLFPAISARVIGAHFWPLSAEQKDNILYIYADNAKVTPNLLDTMLKDGLWLADNLDLQAELV